MRQPALHNQKESGQAIVLIAAIMVALVAALGLAIDGGGMYLLYRDVQNATDSAGLSAAFALCSGGDPQEAGETAARLNGFVTGTDGATVTVLNPPPPDHEFGANTIGARSGNYIVTRIEAEKPSYFIGIVYDGPLVVAVDTISECTPAVGFGWPENSAIISLSPACTASGSGAAVRVTGLGDYETFGGGIYVNASSPPCDSVNTTGNGDIKAGGDGICAQGDIPDEGTSVVATEGGDIVEDCTEVPQIPWPSDPFVENGLTPLDDYCNSATPRTLSTKMFTGPSADADTEAQILNPPTSGAGYNLPGLYSDMDMNNSGEYAYLETGIYCIDGSGGTDTKWAGTLQSNEDDGVLLYFYNQHVSISATAAGTLLLYALTEDDNEYENLLIWHRPTTVVTPSNSDAISLSGQSNFELEGTIYAPNRHCNVTGGSGPNILYAQFICYSFDGNGGSDVRIFYDPSRVFEMPPEFGVTQ